MPGLRFVANLLAVLLTACALPRLAVPPGVDGPPQGASFFTAPDDEAAPLQPAEPALPWLERLPKLDGGALCGNDAGQRARAQCLRGEPLEAANTVLR